MWQLQGLQRRVLEEYRNDHDHMYFRRCSDALVFRKHIMLIFSVWIDLSKTIRPFFLIGQPGHAHSVGGPLDRICPTFTPPGWRTQPRMARRSRWCGHLWMLVALPRYVRHLKSDQFTRWVLSRASKWNFMNAHEKPNMHRLTDWVSRPFLVPSHLTVERERRCNSFLFVFFISGQKMTPGSISDEIGSTNPQTQIYTANTWCEVCATNQGVGLAFPTFPVHPSRTWFGPFFFAQHFVDY